MSPPSRPATVAVVITTYNHARFLLQALQSVMAQTHRAGEIFVIDDGSTDDPAAVASSCAGVTLIRQHNQGLAAARNTGLRAVHSDKVIFLDADDRLLPNAIADGLACFGAAPSCGLVFGAHQRIDAGGQPLGDIVYQSVGPQPYLDLLRGNAIGMHAAAMYDRARLVALGGFDTALKRCEDYDVYLRMARTAPVASHPNTVAEYRWHGGNMSSNHREMLSWVLRVHAREKQPALALEASASAWRHGRWVWRNYYAEQILGATRQRWTEDHSIGRAVHGVLEAVSASPGTTLRALLRAARRRLGRQPTASAGDQPLRPALGTVSFGDLGSVRPISDDFGFDRGTPIDRFYIERFLSDNAADIAGRVLEVGDDAYSRRFGGQQVTQQDVLHVSADNTAATLVGDLSQAGTLPADTFDCLVLTQTLHLVFDLRAAVAEMHRSLKAGGTVLLTVPGISQIDRGQWGAGWFWSLTTASATRLFSELFGAANVRVQSHGNVFAATAFLQGLAVEETDTAKLAFHDPSYPVIVTVRAHKGAA
jgi:glycosyltransferase involved in cell wall biosynthesis/SAM-dependent methyltransferase